MTVTEARGGNVLQLRAWRSVKSIKPEDWFSAYLEMT